MNCFRKAEEEYYTPRVKPPVNSDVCKSCGNIGLELEDYCRICMFCFLQEDIPAFGPDFGDELRVNLHRERILKKPRKPGTTISGENRSSLHYDNPTITH